MVKRSLTVVVKLVAATIAFCLIGILGTYIGLAALVYFSPTSGTSPVVNDVTGLNPVGVRKIVSPTSIEEIRDAVNSATGTVSIGGGRFSMGGQTAARDSLHLDLRGYNKVLALRPELKQVTVQPGITWRDLQEQIDSYNLSIKIMQSYSNFTVGGSLSVNCHGRYLGYGAIVHSVERIKLVLVDGSIVTASRAENSHLFKAAIGGYGGVGVIAEVTLNLDANKKIESKVVSLKPSEYLAHFRDKTLNNDRVVMHNADIFPPSYDTVYVTNWEESQSDLTNPSRLQPRGNDPFLYRFYRFVLNYIPWGKNLRPLLEEYRKNNPEVVWRNFEASYDVKSLGQISSSSGSYILQEYFVPLENFESFKDEMTTILSKNNVKVVNISIRHAIKDDITYLSWSPQDSFAFVLYYYQPSSEDALEHSKNWTRELIRSVISHSGSYYLPYRIVASAEEFKRAYPGSAEYFRIKSEVDPTYKFNNQLWDAYYPPQNSGVATSKHIDASFTRDEVQTYLTLPEWLLVFMSEDQASAYRNGRPNSFRYFGAIYDYWMTYVDIIRITRANYPKINWGYHFMTMTIGVITSAEYFIHGFYEATVGRLADTHSSQISDIERLIGETYTMYASFIHQAPWYEFDFRERYNRARSVSTTTLREKERKFSFIVEMRLKSIMAALFYDGTKAVYGDEDLFLYSTIKGPIAELKDKHPEIEIVNLYGKDTALIKTPRYEAFTELVKHMSGFSFSSIAGNKTIAMSFVREPSCLKHMPGEVLYDLSAWDADIGLRRQAIAGPVEGLVSITNANSCIKGVHVYDY